MVAWSFSIFSYFACPRTNDSATSLSPFGTEIFKARESFSLCVSDFSKLNWTTKNLLGLLYFYTFWVPLICRCQLEWEPETLLEVSGNQNGMADWWMAILRTAWKDPQNFQQTELSRKKWQEKRLAEERTLQLDRFWLDRFWLKLETQGMR